MDEREQQSQERQRQRVRKPVNQHPKPPMRPVNSLNEVIRQELWYVDTVVASPFRTARRQLQSGRGSLAEGLDETLWALEGMTRLPIKVLQAAFGENLGSNPKGAPSAPSGGATGASSREAGGAGDGS